VSWRVIIRPNAEADLQDARSWYESQRTGLGDELLNEVRSAVRLLEEQPERRPIYYNGFRRLIAHRFPYKIFYRIEGAHVIVFRILHAKRDLRAFFLRAFVSWRLILPEKCSENRSQPKPRG